MGYLYSLWNYLKSEKGKHDFLDYLRAIIIIASVMAGVRIMVDVIPEWFHCVSSLL